VVVDSSLSHGGRIICYCNGGFNVVHLNFPYNALDMDILSRNLQCQTDTIKPEVGDRGIIHGE